MGTVKKMSKVMQEDKHTCDSKHMAGDGGVPERVVRCWPHTPQNTISICLWGTISHHCALMYAGQEVPNTLT